MVFVYRILTVHTCQQNNTMVRNHIIFEEKVFDPLEINVRNITVSWG
jgi:hypothetical protein